MNTQLDQLREKMIHETEAFLGQSLHDGSPIPQLRRVPPQGTTPAQPEQPDDRPYFFPAWHDWAPHPQAHSA
jgi:hypothetical protein